MKTAIRRKNYLLDENKIRHAKKILGTKTETETIDRALDLVVFRKELVDSLKKSAGRGGVGSAR
ncbi:MAG: hypothetical protein HZA19_06995 [Nitrospirae bacterium]|nr:hypothetical protein [Nitrospirota bacterium]